jgi:hypothetical protein
MNKKHVVRLTDQERDEWRRCRRRVDMATLYYQYEPL